MSNPLSLLPIAVAASNGRIDGIPAPSLVAAGFTLLQRSAPLVRALSGRPSAVLLPPSPAFLVALAASDGRAAAPLDPAMDNDDLLARLGDIKPGALFTTRALASLLPSLGCSVVLLDDAPRAATVISGGREQLVDLGSHFALDIEGEEDEGSDEECLLLPRVAGKVAVVSHAGILGAARAARRDFAFVQGDTVLALAPMASAASVVLSLAAPLMAGAAVLTCPTSDAASPAAALDAHAVTVIIAETPMFSALADLLEARDAGIRGVLRLVLSVRGAVDPTVAARWESLTGAPLVSAPGVPAANY